MKQAPALDAPGPSCRCRGRSGEAIPRSPARQSGLEEPLRTQDMNETKISEPVE